MAIAGGHETSSSLARPVTGAAIRIIVMIVVVATFFGACALAVAAALGLDSATRIAGALVATAKGEADPSDRDDWRRRNDTDT